MVAFLLLVAVVLVCVIVIKKKNCSCNVAKSAPSKGTKGKTSSSVGAEKFVYVSSKKYHRKDCRFADKNSSPVTLASVKAKKLNPCKVCNPHK